MESAQVLFKGNQRSRSGRQPAPGTWRDRPPCCRQPRTSFSSIGIERGQEKKDSEPRTPAWILFSASSTRRLFLWSPFSSLHCFQLFFFFLLLLSSSSRSLITFFFFFYQLFSSAVANPARPSATPRTPIPSELILSESPVCIHRPRHASLRLQSAIPSRNPPLSPSRIH
ncbi:hypothetical protein M441DRAFT_309728 [Trichoderma asperellum CBS 433.97]|uniref:Uncharacterized protein n=1 Tax=Trichoderma asperellum (strain ATCC 204424 / CBS 433.97 / NBRC 101777) TaxID=1042311 RepID=A0A2T3ZK67_TRIA4|nr:hypothetical protein M441DRAFT_309728 [Trichoderma asperellum CBS 433.97]PTB45200.1 hypothetical protein M441DRAFT_309728 [Trichoderma asperellum CBS 433.97]